MFWIILLCVCVAHAQDGPSVNTTQGVVVGTLVNGTYLAFHGIPYAGSTSGENRYKAPTPAPRFPGIFHAVENNVVCAHSTPRGLVGVEDCLRISILTKNVTTPKPVVVFIQGEDFATWNSKPYSFTKLVQSDLLIVTLNYRLSIFGFLCLGVADAPGNAGLRDVVHGLKWIKENIAGFGGDPNNVVLLGHGSGAAMVDLITLSPHANGLVHKAIALSGSGLAPWAVQYDPVGYANAVGNKLGYGGKNRKDLAKLLATTELNVLEGAIRNSIFTNNTVLFGPCVENIKLNPNDTFLADAPINLLRSGNYIDIPYIGGFTNREGTMRGEQAIFRDWLDKMQSKFSNFISVDLKFDSANNRTDIINSIREFYFSGKEINMKTIQNFLDYEGDTTILFPVIRNALERSLTSKSAVRLFGFAYNGTYDSDWPYRQVPLHGVKHGGILNYLLDFDLKLNEAIVTDTLIKRFAAFAYTGFPAPANETLTTWPTIENNIFYMLYISGEEVAVNVMLFKEEMQGRQVNEKMLNFWYPLYKKYYVPPKAISSAGQLLSFSVMLLCAQIIHWLF